MYPFGKHFLSMYNVQDMILDPRDRAEHKDTEGKNSPSGGPASVSNGLGVEGAK